MAITITNIDVGNVILENGRFQDELLTFTGAGTVFSGTILARDSVSKKLVPFVKGGTTNDNGIPKAVLTYDVTAAGASDVAVRDMVSGSIRSNRLIIAADGNGQNIDGAIIDQLRDYSLVTIDTQELNILDNQ